MKRNNQLTYPRTIDDLNKIYKKEYQQPGDTVNFFYVWATDYLLTEISNLLDTPMNVHGETLETILKAQETKE